MKKTVQSFCLSLIASAGFLPANAQSGFWIVGGQNAVEGQFPWIGDVRASSGNIQYHHCGAALIHPYWAITAAHCIMGDEFGIDNPTHVRFNTVSTYAQNVNPNGGIAVAIDTFYRHMAFDINLGLGNGYDLGLIKLKQPVTGILPIKLPQQADTVNYYQSDGLVTTAGWGLVDTFSFTSADIMKWTHTKIIGRTQCNNYYQGNASVGPVTERVTCVGYNGNDPQSGAAAGDSGGPLWLEANGTQYIVGVVSGGGGMPTTLFEQPGIYTNIAYFRPWIDSVMNANPTSIPKTGDFNDQNISIGMLQNDIKLKIGAISSATIFVQLSNLEGKILHQQTMQHPQSQTFLIPVSGFAQGMYVIRVYDNAGNHIYRKLHKVGQ